MKRYCLHLLALLALLSAACVQREFIPDIESDALRATITSDEAVTRSIVIDNPGIKLESFWKGGDCIGVFGGSVQNTCFNIEESSISFDGKSADFKTGGDIPSGTLLAYYPYSSTASVNARALRLDFPETQHYTSVGGMPQPDPEACVMVGRGSRTGGIRFVNAMAVLKIGQVFPAETIVTSIEFRDLNDKPVCGAYTLDLAEDQPSAAFEGDGMVLTLDLGEGILASKDCLFNTFLVVPARDYPKGFEITFVAGDGNRTVRTIGTKDGKILNRSVVYPVGDVTSYENIPGMVCELKPTAKMMTPEDLDMVKVLRSDTDYVRTDDGSLSVDANGNPIRLPYYELQMHKELNPVVGNWLIFNQASSDLPQGGVYKIQSIKSMADGVHYEVNIAPEANFAAPFKELSIGSPMYDDEGNFLPDGGIDIDISSYIKEMRDGDGNPIELSPGTSYQTNTLDVSTRATHKTFKTPTLTLSMDDKSHCQCEVASTLKLNMRYAVRVFDGELQYIYVTTNPVLDMKTTFSLYGKWEEEKSKHLITLYFTGIPIGPVVLLPEISIGAVGGIGGEVKFSASTTFHFDVGTYGLIYHVDSGFNFRHDAPKPDVDDSFSPDLDASFTGNLYAFGGISLDAGVSIYGLCSIGARTKAKLNFGIMQESSHQDAKYMATKLHLTPEIEIAPYTAIVGGKWSHVWKGLSGKIELEPLWERYLTPEIRAPHSGVIYEITENNVKFAMHPKDTVYMQVPKSVNRVSYSATFKYKTIKSYQLALDIYEGTVTPYTTAFDSQVASLGYSLEEWTASGNPHLYPGGWSFRKGTLLHRSHLGIFPEQALSNDQEVTIAGTYNYGGFQSGQGYLVALSLLDSAGELVAPLELATGPGQYDDGTYEPYKERSVRSSTGENRIVWYFYPADAYGTPYKDGGKPLF